jgi:HlyD family secretion protein
MHTVRNLALGAVGVVIVVGALGSAVLGLHPWSSNDEAGGETGRKSTLHEKGAITVKAINPKNDPKYVLSVQELATVEAFNKADLRSRVAGQVKQVHKGLGDRVVRGEVLVELDVPDLEQAVKQKESVIAQRRQELLIAQARVHDARAMIVVAQALTDQRKAEVVLAEVTADLRHKRLDRLMVLKKGDIVNDRLLDEEVRDVRAADVATEVARLAVKKAEADSLEKESLLGIQLADVEDKRASIDVAIQDRDYAKALASYALLTAPFDGVVTARSVDVGKFVQNAATGHADPVMSVARTDIVTVVVQVPDNVAGLVDGDTEAVVQFEELPGVLVRGPVTRFARAIQKSDRTMTVEVDLYNGTEEEFARYKAKTFAGFLAPIGQQNLGPAAGLLGGSRAVWSQNSKGRADPLPLPVVGLDNVESKQRFLDGMSGYMRLLLRTHSAHLVPSSAVFSKGGKTYILEVRDNVSHPVPVRVQLNDGTLAKIALIVREANPSHGEPEIVKELTGGEVIVLNRQIEVGDGAPVQVTMQPW